MILQDESYRNKWRLAKVIDVYKDKNGYVRSVQLYIGNSELNTLVSRVLVRPISKIVLLVESNEEVRSPTGEPQRIHLIKIIIVTLERSQLYMDLTAMLAAILTAIVDPENVFRFVELLLKKQSCFDKILIDLFTKLWLVVTVGVKVLNG